jgi:SP family xylose:H+ symportor-like MFS transporter
MYISEISPSHLRGSTVSFYQLSITLGQTGVFFVNYLIAKGMSEEWIVNWGWRWMLGSEAIPAILFASLLLLIPESPRWLILKGKEQKARDILKKFTPLDSVEKLISEIHESCFGHQQSPGKEASNNSTSLLSPSVFGIVALGVFLACAQQLTGVNVVMYYAPEILKEVVSSTESSLFQTSIMGVMYLVGNLLGIFLIDRLGRRPLLIFGGLGVSLSMAALGYVIFSQTVGYAALACLIVYVISISFSWGCVGWTLIAEIFPNRIRSKAMGVAVASVWITNFFVVQSFPMLHQNPTLQELFNGGFTFWVYAAISLISIVIVAKFVPETKGKTLEELEAITMSGKA